MCQFDSAMGAQVFGQTLFSVILWGLLLMSLAFKIVDRVKQIALPGWVGLVQYAECLNSRKGLPFPEQEGILSAWLCSNWKFAFLLPSHSCWNTGSSWVLSLLAFRQTYTISFPGSPAFRLGLETNHQLSLVSSLPSPFADLGNWTCHFHNHVIQFLIMNLYIYIYIISLYLYDLLLVLFLWGSLINTSPNHHTIFHFSKWLKDVFLHTVWIEFHIIFLKSININPTYGKVTKCFLFYGIS